MNNKQMIDRAKELREQADELEKMANRKRPKKWEVGMNVRYIVDKYWGPRKGSEAVIVQIAESTAGKQADEYQVFWCEPKNGSGKFWTTPSDVELI